MLKINPELPTSWTLSFQFHLKPACSVLACAVKLSISWNYFQRWSPTAPKKGYRLKLIPSVQIHMQDFAPLSRRISLVSEHSVIILFIINFANLGFMKLTSKGYLSPLFTGLRLVFMDTKSRIYFKNLMLYFTWTLKILLIIIKTKHLPNQINMQHLFISYKINSIIKIICVKIWYRGI